jgi:hypothetical protein
MKGKKVEEVREVEELEDRMDAGVNIGWTTDPSPGGLICTGMVGVRRWRHNRRNDGSWLLAKLSIKP